MLDWSEGTYERTAATLVGATDVGVAAAAIAAGDRVLDLGCGTGNAALAAARLGAKVVAVDPAERLVGVAKARATSEEFAIDFSAGDASAIPAGDASFDAVLSIFAVIFAPDAERAAAEMLRVVRPGGRIVLTSWLARDALAEAGKLVRDAMAALEPASPARAAPQWGDEVFVRGLFEPRGARVELREEKLVFEAASAAAWFAEQAEHHPAWRLARRVLTGREGAWESLRDRSVERLRAGNESRDALRVTSPYLLVTVHR